MQIPMGHMRFGLPIENRTFTVNGHAGFPEG